MRRTDLMDTSPWAHRELVRRLREMTPSERLGIAIRRSDESRLLFNKGTERYFDRLRKSKS